MASYNKFPKPDPLSLNQKQERKMDEPASEVGLNYVLSVCMR